MYYIYKIENLENHKKYIGLTNNIKRRRARHFTDLKCGRHDNKFLQKEYNIFGKDKFDFTIEFSGDVTSKEISTLEEEYILKYDSYENGYNQNTGGNFGPSNGGTTLIKTDIFNILAALEFMSRPGQILADMYSTTRTTISRIKRGENHSQYKEEYDKLPLESRKEIYQIFCDSTNFIEDKKNTTIIQSKRKLSEHQVHLILLNYERKIIPITHMAAKVGVASRNTLETIKKGLSYQDFALTYNKLTENEKNQLASLLSN